jgi:hypothetical protein
VNADRRDFLALSVSLGLATLLPPRALAGVAKRFHGPLRGAVAALLRRVDRHELDAPGFVDELSKRYDDVALAHDLATWIDAPHEDDAMVELLREPIGSHGLSMMLFFLGKNAAHPPHAHHDLMSAQCVLRGRVQLRQFDRLARLDPSTLALRLTRDTELSPGGRLLMTEHEDNVHWFGTAGAPALIFNVNVAGTPGATFDARGSRGRGRYYVDPTSGERHDGAIVARELSGEEAHARFARRPLADFPVG